MSLHRRRNGIRTLEVETIVAHTSAYENCCTQGDHVVCPRFLGSNGAYDYSYQA